MAPKRKLVRCPLCEKAAALKPKRLAICEKRLKLLEAQNRRRGESDQLELDDPCVDWKNKNVLNKVMNQKSCGCCWAVGACRCTDAVHRLTKKVKQLIELSPQDLINSIPLPPFEMLNFEDEEDREKEIERHAENRGFGYILREAYQHMKVKGVRFASQVPFAGIRTETLPPKQAERLLKIKDFVPIPDDDALLDAVRSHPVAARLTMSKGTEEIFYGARRNREDKYVRHVVMIVGYCTLDQVSCWRIQNSYGEKWGRDGFGYIPLASSLPPEYDLQLSHAFCPII